MQAKSKISMFAQDCMVSNGSYGCERLEREVAGEYKTFRLYLFMLRVRKASARHAQRALGFFKFLAGKFPI